MVYIADLKRNLLPSDAAPAVGTGLTSIPVANAPGRIRGGPLAVCSGGVMLLVVGAALILPGHDISEYHRDQQQAEDPLLLSSQLPIAGPWLSQQAHVTVFSHRNRSVFHWREDCRTLVNRPEHGWRSRVMSITYGQARERGYRPCPWCQRADLEAAQSNAELAGPT